MRRAALLAAAALAALVLPSAAATGAATAAEPQREVGLPGWSGFVTTTQSVAGQPRGYWLHVPDGLLGPAPLVLALHALHQTPSTSRRATGLEALADRHGFVVAFPGGSYGSWNAGACCGRARDARVDDVAFLDEVVASVRSRVLVDSARIGVTGFSNGAMMSLRYACERAGTVAAAAVVAGPLAVDCRAAAPVPVLALHGRADGVVPLAGGLNRQLRAAFPPLRDSLDPFRDVGSEVEVRVIDGGHGWPRGGTAAVWRWLSTHPRR